MNNSNPRHFITCLWFLFSITRHNCSLTSFCLKKKASGRTLHSSLPVVLTSQVIFLSSIADCRCKMESVRTRSNPQLRRGLLLQFFSCNPQLLLKLLKNVLLIFCKRINNNNKIILSQKFYYELFGLLKKKKDLSRPKWLGSFGMFSIVIHSSEFVHLLIVVQVFAFQMPKESHLSLSLAGVWLELQLLALFMMPHFRCADNDVNWVLWFCPWNFTWYLLCIKSRSRSRRFLFVF